jgi:pSer/pThr/pTyr-binding forkhead associated (FHA) protein
VPQGQQSEHVFSSLDRHHIKSNADRKISLTVTDSKGKSKNIEVDFDRSIFIGRSDQCEVFFDDPQISRQHCVIEQSDDSFFVTDLNTTNGTYLNGVKIHSKEKLASGDVLTVGQFKLTLSLKDLLNENVVNP